MKTWKKLLALMLALAMVFAFTACDNGKDDDDDDDDKKGSSSIEETKPQETEPEETEPEATEPEVTEPEVTEPEVTEPEKTEPEKTEPEVTEPEVYGKWAMNINTIHYMNLSVIGDVGGLVALPDMTVNLVMSLEIDLDGDFDMSFTFNEDDMLAYFEAASQVVTDYLIATYEAQGVSQADLEAMLEMSAYDYSSSIVYEYMVMVEDNITAMNMRGLCKLDGDKLYIGSDEEEIANPTDYFIVSVDGDKLSVTGLGGDGADMIVMAIEMMGAELPWVYARQ